MKKFVALLLLLTACSTPGQSSVSANSLEGCWVPPDAAGDAKLTITKTSENNYSMNLSQTLPDGRVNSASGKGQTNGSMLTSDLSGLSESYDYSVSDNKLTLTLKESKNPSAKIGKTDVATRCK